MMDELKSIILERSFELLGANGKSEKISLFIGKPYQISESDVSLTWRCPYQIVGIGLEKIKEGPGIDSIDAMLMSLQIAEAYLKSYGQTEGKTITWLGEDDLGLSIMSQYANVSETDDSSYEKIFNKLFGDRDLSNLPSETATDIE